jgi:hypothetical protein
LSLEQLYNLFSVLSVSLLMTPASSQVGADDSDEQFSRDQRIDELISSEYQLFYFQQSRILIWKALSFMIFTPGILNYSNFHLMKHLLMKFIQR